MKSRDADDFNLEIFDEAVSDARIPADVRYQALRGLTAIAHHKGLPADLTSRLGDFPERGAAAIFVQPSAQYRLTFRRYVLMALTSTIRGADLRAARHQIARERPACLSGQAV